MLRSTWTQKTFKTQWAYSVFSGKKKEKKKKNLPSRNDVNMAKFSWLGSQASAAIITAAITLKWIMEDTRHDQGRIIAASTCCIDQLSHIVSLYNINCIFRRRSKVLRNCNMLHTSKDFLALRNTNLPYLFVLSMIFK